jgi:predicted amidohydrolase
MPRTTIQLAIGRAIVEVGTLQENRGRAAEMMRRAGAEGAQIVVPAECTDPATVEETC